MTHGFPPNRTAALERLARFVPRAGRDYAARRNYDFGPNQHLHVSTLSPYLRSRLITEEEVLQAVLARHSPQAAEKFIQEVYWRTYWKGWLEQRPQVWSAYQAGTYRARNDIQTQSGLRQRWEQACTGDTGIDCIDFWAQELVNTGYLHNHARMWFASIWIFTLELPWELGADFFLRHLLDGDPASNTLSWRWVAGLQTVGKTYLARPDNIRKYTHNRFDPNGALASYAPPLPAQPAPTPAGLTDQQKPNGTANTGFLMTTEDLSPAHLFDLGLTPTHTLPLNASAGLSPLAMAPNVLAWQNAALKDACDRWQDRLGQIAEPALTADTIVTWAKDSGLQEIVTAYIPVGPTATRLAEAQTKLDIPIKQVQRRYDRAAWPCATKGFFKFKEHIPRLLSELGVAQAA